MTTLITALITAVRAVPRSRANLALENLALRQQLTIYHRGQRHPRLRAGDRVFWVPLRRLWSGWDRCLLVVRPETVIAWHRRGFKLIWRRRSRDLRVGRPRIPRQHRLFIRRMSSDHPEWGEDKISEELAAKFGIPHSGSTIRRYMVWRTDGPRKTQTWCTLLPLDSSAPGKSQGQVAAQTVPHATQLAQESPAAANSTDARAAFRSRPLRFGWKTSAMG